MADNSVLDSILEDALQEYESVDNAASAAATTVTTAPEPTAPASESAEKSQSRDEERLFPPSSDEIAATFQALMTQLGASADAPNADDTSVPPPASSSSSSSSSGPISDAAAEAQADEALKDYLSAISAGPSDSGNDDSAASFDSNAFGALLGLLKPFISKELLYGPFSQMRTLYPDWLERNKETLPPKEHEQRREQYEIICRVCKLYEEQKSPDDNLQEIMVLIEKMGQAPQELIDEASKSCDGQMPDLSMFGGPSNGAAGAGGGENGEGLPEPECVIM